MSRKRKNEEKKPMTDENRGAAPPAAMVTVVRTADAEKLNPSRSGGPVTYQVGRLAGEVYLRLLANSGGGRFSREWVPLSRIRACFTPAVLKGQPFKARTLDNAFQGRSSTNTGFLTAVLRAEMLAAGDPKHKGMSLLCADLGDWAEKVLAAEPVKNGDGTDLLEPLHPPVRENRLNFPNRNASPIEPGGEDASADGAATSIKDDD